MHSVCFCQYTHMSVYIIYINNITCNIQDYLTVLTFDFPKHFVRHYFLLDLIGLKFLSSLTINFMDRR